MLAWDQFSKPKGVGLRVSRRAKLHAALQRLRACVHACVQVASFYTWSALSEAQVLGAINAARPGRLRATQLREVPRAYHATFAAQWRR